jgi:hypothetical protein
MVTMAAFQFPADNRYDHLLDEPLRRATEFMATKTGR